MGSFISKIKWKKDKFSFSLLEKENALFNRYSHRDNLIISGTGRSGTTWLAEVISSKEEFTLVNEPMKNSNSYAVQRLGFTGWGQYIPEDEKWPEANSFFNRLFTGRELNPNYFNIQRPSRNTEVWVHKMIRAPFMLPWLVRNFEIRPPIHIIRDPRAVVASQLNHVGFGKGKKFHQRPLPQFPNFNEFYQEYFQPALKATSLVEHLTYHWALQNKFVTEHPLCGKSWLVVNYEDLLLNSSETLQNIGEWWGLDLSYVEEKNLAKMSRSVETEVSSDPQIQLNKWKTVLNKQQLNEIDGVLSVLGMETH